MNTIVEVTFLSRTNTEVSVVNMRGIFKRCCDRCARTVRRTDGERVNCVGRLKGR